jgi:ectoine hydroxylase-related dioxygenase (phytanoyl-CoA dioxygenase family)
MNSLTKPKIINEYFQENGYVLVEDVLDPKTVLDPIISEYEKVLDNLCKELYEKKEIKSLYSDLEFDERIIKVYNETGKNYAYYFDFHLPFKNVKPDTPFWCGPAVFNALINKNLLDIVEELIGGEITSNPVQHVRIKPPENRLPKDEDGFPLIGATIWHQDHGVVTEDADETDMITVWFSLTDTPVEAGPLKVVPGSHKGDLLTHCLDYEGNGEEFKKSRQIPTKLFSHEEGIPLPMKRGSAIFMHKRTVHSSLPNISNRMRWSFDLRYNPTGQNTGRSMFPGFVARSRNYPESELRDLIVWNNMWLECREKMSKINQDDSDDVKFSRWADGHPDCEV